MSNPSKEKGTRAETRVVRYLESMGIQAERKALSGSKDEGDVKVVGCGWSECLMLEVKSGKQTANPTRKQLEEWCRQTKVEAKNSGFDCLLVVARYGKNPSDYDVWEPLKDGSYMLHWYLDDWCKEYK